MIIRGLIIYALGLSAFILLQDILIGGYLRLASLGVFCHLLKGAYLGMLLYASDKIHYKATPPMTSKL